MMRRIPMFAALVLVTATGDDRVRQEEGRDAGARARAAARPPGHHAAAAARSGAAATGARSGRRRPRTSCSRG